MQSTKRVILRGGIFAAVFLAIVAPVADAGEQWLWSLTPYIWASDISDEVTFRGQDAGGGDTSFQDLADLADTSFQIHFEGTRDRWGMFADLMYVELSDTQTGDAGLLSLDVGIKEVVFEAGAIYRPGGRSGRLDLLFGTRVFSVDESYRYQLGDLEPFEAGIDDVFPDILIGARYHIPLSQRWIISLKGDVSAGGTDYIWTAQGMVGWRFGAKRNSGVFVGYRYRDMKYTKGDAFDVRKTLSGPGIAVRIGF